ncbi:MAG: patatin-like phospholipase family protein [Pirellulales bacterium]|nr:patatin-like phospholipase family protein [Pirellulales bacterium]
MASDTDPRQGRLTLPREVRDEERKYLDGRRQEAGVQSEAPLVGVALSGGGIRSATFCLGALQALAERGILRLADYLCTVSGGGYVGSCLSSLTTVLDEKRLLERRKRKWPDDRRSLHGWETARGRKSSFSAASPDAQSMPLLTCEQIHHLRKHGDMLVLGRGLYRREIVRAVGTFVVGWLALLTLLLSALLTLICGYYGYLWLFGGEAVWGHLASRRWSELPRLVVLLQPDWVLCAVTAGAGALYGAAAFRNAFVHDLAHSDARSGETAEDLAERRQLTYFGLGMAATIAVIGLAWRCGGLGCGPMLSELWSPVAFSLGTLGAVGGLYLVVCALFSQRWNRPKRSLFGAMQGVCVYYVMGTLGLLGFTLLVWWVDPITVSGAIKVLVGFAIDLGLIQLLAKVGRSKPQGTWSVVGALGKRILLALAVLVFLGAASVVCTQVLLQLGDAALWILVAAPGAFVLLGFGININRISLHYFYRDRLVETYLRTEAGGSNGLEIVRDDEPLRVADLHDRFVGKRDKSSAANTSPYHLILCALNLVGSRDLARKDRKSDHFIFSKHYCGSTTTGYVPTETYRGGQTKLCTAMTISGAAASSGMGCKTSFFTAFALTLLNVRLGYWLLNPRLFGPVYPEYHEPPQSEYRILSRRNLYDELWTFWPACLFREMFAATNAQSRLVHLSDGGHTGDNLGLYPLLQRRCKLIVVCDAECDGDYAFSSFAAAVQQIFADENVVVDINLDNIRPQPGAGTSRKHFAVGKIHYPACPPAESKASASDCDRSADTGWLIYIKASCTGADDPVAVGCYARQHPEFPHETTADQCFDDDQFEAYRALGHHAGIEAATKGFIHLDIGGKPVNTLGALARQCTSKGATVPPAAVSH